MAKESNIQWTDATWNIARGCTKVDEDCKFCYMYRDSLEGTRYEPKTVTKTKTVFNLPLKLKEPSKIFTSSLTDVFHEDCDSFRGEMWDIIRQCPQHTFQVLTKRPERILKHLPEDWGNGWDNVWLGTSVGSNVSRNRITQLLEVPAKIHFASLEPLHGPVNLAGFLFSVRNKVQTYQHYLDWVIVGGESGNDNGKYRYRPCEFEWIESIVRQCKEQDTPVFVKQLGTYLAKRFCLSDRHGGNIEELAEHLQVREFPTP